MNPIKTCKVCDESKPQEEFPVHSKEKNTRRIQCNECYNKIRRERYLENQEIRRIQNKESYIRHREKRIEGAKKYAKNNPDKIKVWSKKIRERKIQFYREFKGTLKCETCSESHPECLDFHHRDPDDKLHLISKLVYCKNKLQEEVKKCIVLCANCHRKLHYELKQQHKNHVLNQTNPTIPIDEIEDDFVI